MTWVAIINWIIVGALVAILWTDYQAIRYFRGQERLMGANWVLHEYLRTAWVFFWVYGIFTAGRIATLLFSPVPTFNADPFRVITSITVGVAFLWLGLKPYRQRRLFQAHEGRE
jgi:hypothetical protein